MKKIKFLEFKYIKNELEKTNSLNESLSVTNRNSLINDNINLLDNRDKMKVFFLRFSKIH